MVRPYNTCSGCHQYAGGKIITSRGALCPDCIINFIDKFTWKPIDTLPEDYVGQVLLYDDTGGMVGRPDLEPIPDYVEFWMPFPYPQKKTE